MPHERLQEFVIIDYTKEIVILATVKDANGQEKVIGVGQYSIIEGAHTADVAFTVADEEQNKGVGYELLNYLSYLAKGKGILAFTADVLVENLPMQHLFGKISPDIKRVVEGGVIELQIPLASDVGFAR
jgi:RimJ/RimL family protein N-acetyltransferase